MYKLRESASSLQFHFWLTRAKMCQYIDINKLVDALPQKCQCTLYEPRYCHHLEIAIDFPICLAQEEILDSCMTKKVQSCTVIYNVPLSHYVEYKGISTNIGIFTKDGVLANDTCGYVHVYVYNSSTESRVLPIGMRIGSLSLKKYYNPSDESVCT